MIKKVLFTIGRLIISIFNGMILIVIVPLGTIIMPLVLYDILSSGEPLALVHLVIATLVGWTIPYTQMLFFFMLFKRTYQGEYQRETDGEGFVGYFWRNNGPIAMHTLISRIAWHSGNRYTSGLVAYARICWLLNWLWIPMFVVIILVAVL